MKKICFIGTSHLGVLYRAWANGIQAEYSEVSSDFFAAPGTTLRSAELLDGKIVANEPKLKDFFQQSSEGMSEVVIDNYDAFVFHGLAFPLFKAHDLLQTHCLHTADATNEGKYYISSACLEACFENTIEGNVIRNSISHVRRFTNKKILVSMSPMFSELEKQSKENDYSLVQSEAAILMSLFLSARKRVFDDLSIAFIEQPQETLATTLFTQKKYTMGYQQAKSDDLQNIRSYGHMGIEYGGIALRRILDNLLGT